MRKMRNCVQLIFDARKMRNFAPTRKSVAITRVPFPVFTVSQRCQLYEVTSSVRALLKEQQVAFQLARFEIDATHT